MSSEFIEFHVKRFRSLLDVKLRLDKSEPVVICGENNIGKTNYLRALHIFFEHFTDHALFVPERDIPHHIYHGARGGSANTELSGTFLVSGKKQTLAVTFDSRGHPTYKFDKKTINADKASQFLSDYRYLFVESTNIDLPKLISLVLEEDGLIRLDSKRRHQTEPLEKLQEFIAMSQKAISDIEKDINAYFSKLVDFDGVLKSKRIQIKFAEFGRLRDAVKSMTSITLLDGNRHGMASKGSGAQRAVFLSLLQYIAANSKKKIIWGIDEPEAFLQPQLQKRVFGVLREMVEEKAQKIILTTHSPHFVNLQNLEHTHVFVGCIEERTYQRRPGEVFYELDTKAAVTSSWVEKAQQIKTHLGMSGNDGWEVMPINIVVEGECDKNYLEAIFAHIALPPPHIIYAGGASKVAGYLQYYDSFAGELPFKPIFRCVFDNDQEGKSNADSLAKKKFKNISVELVQLPRYDGCLPADVRGAAWEIEDYLPLELIATALNQILKKHGYKIVTKTNIGDREKTAHRNMKVLSYLDKCISHRNPDLNAFELDSQGRKLQLCRQICMNLLASEKPFGLNDGQLDFLKALST